MVSKSRNCLEKYSQLEFTYRVTHTWLLLSASKDSTSSNNSIASHLVCMNTGSLTSNKVSKFTTTIDFPVKLRASILLICIVGILLKEQEFMEVCYRYAVQRQDCFGKLSVNITMSAIIVSEMMQLFQELPILYLEAIVPQESSKCLIFTMVCGESIKQKHL